MMPSGVMPSLRARSWSSSRPLPSPSMMLRYRRSPVGSAASSDARWSRSAAVSTPANMSSMLASGSYVVLPSASYSRRSQTRSNATWRCSSGSEASGTILAASMMPLDRPASGLVQEHRVQDDARCRVQAEGHIRDAERGVDAGILRGDLADGLDRFNAVPAGLFLAGGDRESQAVDDNVLYAHPPFTHQGVDEARGDRHLALGGARLAVLVDGQGDHGGTVFLHERHDAREAAVRAVAVLIVDGVDDRAPADVFEP